MKEMCRQDSEALLTWVTLQIPFQWPYTEDRDPAAAGYMWMM